MSRGAGRPWLVGIGFLWLVGIGFLWLVGIGFLWLGVGGGGPVDGFAIGVGLAVDYDRRRPVA